MTERLQFAPIKRFGDKGEAWEIKDGLGRANVWLTS